MASEIDVNLLSGSEKTNHTYIRLIIIKLDIFLLHIILDY